MSKLKLGQRSAGAALAMLLALAVPVTASAAEKVRFAYLKTVSLLPFFYATQQGYFTAEGIDMDLIAVPGGPAVGAAIASGSADIGYAAPPPVMIARQQGQPFRFFMALEYEKTPERLWGYIVASKKSGIQSLKEAAGKSVALGPPGGLCELGMRDWLAKAGVAYKDIKPLNNPFPQMPAMLEIGTADIACIADPFASAALSAKNPAKLLDRGYLAAYPNTYRIEGLFASETWIAAHPREIAGIKKAFIRAATELKSNVPLVKKLLVDEYKLPPSLIDEKMLDRILDVEPVASEFQPLADKMYSYGMLSKPLKAEDIIATAK